MSTLRAVNPAGWSPAPGYSHAVATSGRPLLFVSGQVSTDAGGKVVGAGDFAAQAEQAFQNLRTVLAAAGASFADVLKLTYFVVGLDDERLMMVRRVRDRFLAEPPPASTLLGVQALARRDFLIEIEAVAEVP